MLRITLRIDKNRLSVKNLDFVTSGCVNSATCVFMFGDEWEPYQKTAAFACDGVTYHVSIRDNACMLPNAVMQHRGEVSVGIIGIDTTNNKTVTTNNVRLRVIDGADKDGTSDPAYTPTFIEEATKTLEKMKELVGVVDSVTQWGTF